MSLKLLRLRKLGKNRSSCVLLCLSPLVLFLMFWFLRPGPQHDFGLGVTQAGITSHWGVDLEMLLPRIAPYSLTAILPVTLGSITTLEESLSSMFKPSNRLREIILICQPSVRSQARAVIRRVTSPELGGATLTLSTLADGIDPASGTVNAVSEVSTKWVLFVDHQGLIRENNRTQHTLLNPPASTLPLGPRGVLVSANNVSCIMSDLHKPATYLYPPIVMPTSLAKGFFPATGAVWAGLGHHISTYRADGLGGMVIGGGTTTTDWCSIVGRKAPSSQRFLQPHYPQLFDDSISNTRILNQPVNASDLGVFGILLPTLSDFQLLNPLVCMVHNAGHRVEAFLYDESANGSGDDVLEYEDRGLTSQHCTLPYAIRSRYLGKSGGPAGHIPAINWLQTLSFRPDVLIYLREDDDLTAYLLSIQKSGFLRNTVFIRLSREDLPYSTWMGSLSITEWRNWNLPRVDISIITKDRPHSLARLLASLSQGRFFGDTADLRVCMEQSSDPKTMEIVRELSWTRGGLFLHHRIIHGGLLPAVVESWYPRSNDTYGLLLEDDVELSPLFYAWTKMALLRYRYGDPNSRSPRMFGISLYQQKNLELSPEGRKPFNARVLFSKEKLPNPSTPYLSPVPCSWGAIYFPEHWREFHAYLSIRLSESSMKINQVVVPNVRSNKWTKSWKKYLVELVYLRGYVMLYPNYPDFLSLSTNHLEVGSHVRIRTKAKQELFLLPLMELHTASSPPTTINILDIPNNRMPHWDALPVLNLTGSLTSSEALLAVGQFRRTKLTGCINTPMPFDVWDLLCIQRTA